MKNYLKLKKRIKKNEGFKNIAYLDSLGFYTIGYGHLIKAYEKNLLKKKFSKNFLIKIFNKDFDKVLKDYQKTYKKNNYSKQIKEFLIEMIFQLGLKKQKKFIKMKKYLKKKQIFMAALEMKSSLWYNQTPKRVDGLINILLKYKNEK